MSPPDQNIYQKIDVQMLWKKYVETLISKDDEHNNNLITFEFRYLRKDDKVFLRHKNEIVYFVAQNYESMNLDVFFFYNV